jgi:hypothetical protein
MVPPELKPDWELLSDILLRDRECPSAADVLARLRAIEKQQVAAAGAATAAPVPTDKETAGTAPGKSWTPTPTSQAL